RDMALQYQQGGLPLVLAAETSIRATLELEMRLLGPLLAQREAKPALPAVTRIERVIIEGVAPKPRPDAVEAAVCAPAMDVEPTAPTPAPLVPSPARNVVRLDDRPLVLWGRTTGS